MILSKIMFGLCLLLLFGSYTALMAAQRKGDKRQARVLHFFRLGLSLSAISYFLRITDSPPVGHPIVLILATCLAGTTFIWLGWVEQWKLRVERLSAPTTLRGEEDETVNEALLTPMSAGVSLPRLTARARQVLLHAQSEAFCRNDCCVDTDHLLLGLLRERRSAGVQVLDLLRASPEKVQVELLGQMASSRKVMEEHPIAIAQRAITEPSALTEGAMQVLALAAQEAHRFDETSVGTEHLLLGLVLMGKGKAAAVLFGAGVTVDGIRKAIVKAKPPTDPQKR